MAHSVKLISHVYFARKHANKRSDNRIRANASICGIVIGAVVILLVLSFGEFNSSGSCTDYYANVLALGRTESAKIDSRVFSCLIGCEERHGNGSLYAI